MSDLVTINNGTPVTTTLAIAEGTEVEHKAVIQLVRTYVADLEKFGRVAFEMAPFETNGGTQQREIAILNERQATLAISYMRNTEIVRAFKIRLVTKFYEMAEELKAAHESQKQRPLAMDAILQLPACLGAIKSVFPNLGEASLQEIISRATRIDFGEALIPLPVITEQTWTATELAEEFGVSANKIGRIANACGLKTAEFGEHRLSKSRHSSKQIEQFHYNKKGRAALALMLAETTEMLS